MSPVRAADLWPDEDDDETGLGDVMSPLARALGVLDEAEDAGPEPDVAYRHDPIGWAVDRLGIPRESLVWSLNPGYDVHAWDGTEDPLVVIAEALAAGDDVGVESGTGTGKSYFAAVLILWFLACWKGARVYTFAPKEEQLTQFIWAEIGKLWGRFVERFPTAEFTALRIRMDTRTEAADAWGARGYAVGVRAGEDVATRAAGMHAEHMLLVTEETPGIDPAVMAANENTCTAPHNLRLAIGNPDHQLDTLHAFCESPGVTPVRISSLDHPNVVSDDASLIPGAVSRKAIDRRLRKYGEDSRLYQSRVRGLSPAEAEDALIALEWCRAAAARYADRTFRVGGTALGVDVAQSQNGDKAAVARWEGACLVRVKGFPCNNATKLGRDVWGLSQRLGVTPWHVGVDPVGVGAATVNALDEAAAAARSTSRVQRLGGGEGPAPGIGRAPDGASMDWVPDANHFKNLRAQMWWQLREDLRLGRIALPNDPALFAQLTTPTYRVVNGKVLVESKDDIRKRSGGKSPDEADAVVYGNWVRPRRALPPAPPPPDADRHPGWTHDADGRRVARPTRTLDRELAASGTPTRPPTRTPLGEALHRHFTGAGGAPSARPRGMERLIPGGIRPYGR